MIMFRYQIYHILNIILYFAERDEFSNKPTKLGSKSLVTLLNSKLEVHDKTRIETSYENF